MSVDWSKFVYVCNPGVGQNITTLYPAFSVTFHIHHPDYPALQQLFEAAMKLVQPGLTHYQAEEMKRPAPIHDRALGMIPTWLRKPRVGHMYWWVAGGGDDLGCAAPAFDFTLFVGPVTTPAQKLKAIANLIQMQGVGEIRSQFNSTTIRILLPVDHPLTSGPVLLDWLNDLAIVKSGAYIFGEAGYTLSSLASPFGGETERLEREFCSRYPGLDCPRRVHTLSMFRADPDFPDFVPLVRRAAWTTLLHPFTITFLGGETKIRQELANEPQIKVETLPHGLAIQAGDQPQLGDLSRGDVLPLQRKVAAVLRPARITRPAERNEFWDHFFNIFDKNYS